MADARPFIGVSPDPVTREVIRIEGGVPLHGRCRSAAEERRLNVRGGDAHRRALPVHDVPEIEDVRVMADTLRDLGCVVDHPEQNTYEVASGDVEWLFVPLEAAAKMRASFILLGPLLSGSAGDHQQPRGDRIGRRPVDLHVEAMRALGATIEYRNGYYFATPRPLRGTEVRFPFVSVMGTENAMLAARSPTATPSSGPPRRSRGRRPDRLPLQDGRRGRADRPRHDRGHGKRACAAPSTDVIPTGSRPARSPSPAR
jgi:hypothetical protein